MTKLGLVRPIQSFFESQKDQFVFKRLDTLITLLIQEKTSLQNNITETRQSFLLRSSKTPYLELRLAIDQSILFFCVLLLYISYQNLLTIPSVSVGWRKGCSQLKGKLYSVHHRIERTESICSVLFVFTKQKSQRITARSTPNSRTTVIPYVSSRFCGSVLLLYTTKGLL